MVNSNYINHNSQREWFKSINSKNLRYYIYSYGLQDIGAVNLSSINIKNKTFECGIYCGDKSFLSHWINIWACIEVYDFAFFKLKLNTSYAIILKNNSAALSLNKSLGYVKLKEKDNVSDLFKLTKEAYNNYSKKIKIYLKNFVHQ